MTRFRFMERDRDALQDIRLCGDCKNAIENPGAVHRTINRLLLCKATLTPVTFSQSANYCKDYKV